jgi:hypothetical protein
MDGRYGVSWSEPPIAVVSSPPYVVAALPRFIEVRMVDTQALVQMVNVQVSLDPWSALE